MTEPDRKPRAAAARPAKPRVRKPEPARVLVLRTCNADMTSHGGFRWPESGPVEAPDWSPEPECGNGLHGWLWGEGDGNLGDWSPDAKWLVVSVVAADVIDLGGKVKFPRGEVVYCGDRKGATDYLIANVAAGKAVIGASVVAGYGGHATVGDWGQATAGYGGHATVGDWGQATVGDWGQATAGDCGQATARDWGQATAGDCGQATAGYRGQATAGYRGQATAGDCGQATAGDWGVLCLARWDVGAGRRRLVVAYVGEDGIEPNVPYRLDVAGNVVRADTPGKGVTRVEETHAAERDDADSPAG
jgi:hypothetical protein